MALLGVLGGAGLGCAAQAEPDYLGEPLAVVHGDVVTNDTPPSDAIDAALLWFPYTAGEGGDSLKLASTTVHGSFPASFTLDILSPPPPPDSSDGVRTAVVAAVKHGTGSRAYVEDIVGVATNTLVVYFSRDSATPTDDVGQMAKRFGVEPTRGYHLAIDEVTVEREAAYFSCTYGDVCEHEHYSNDYTNATPTGLAWIQAQADEDYALCTHYLPDAARCDITVNSMDEHPEEAECAALIQARFDRTQGTLCPLPWVFLPNPDDFGHAVTVKLGKTMQDFLYPRTDD